MVSRATVRLSDILAFQLRSSRTTADALGRLGQEADLASLDLQGKILRVDAALREAARNEPKPGLCSSREHVAQFLSIAKSPNRAEAGGNAIAKQSADQILLSLVARREHDQVGSKRFAGTHERPGCHEPGDIRELRQSNLAFNDQIRTADIEVVASAAREILELPARSIFAEIELEAATLEPLEQFFIHLPRGFGQYDVAFPYQWKRHRRRNEIAILERRSFVIERILQLGARLDIDDHG